MRLKLDENVDPRAGPILQAAGHDVASVAGERLSGKPDAAIAGACLREARCFVTLDLDFANVLAYPPEEYPGLVVLRHPSPTAAGQVHLAFVNTRNAVTATECLQRGTVDQSVVYAPFSFKANGLL